MSTEVSHPFCRLLSFVIIHLNSNNVRIMPVCCWFIFTFIVGVMVVMMLVLLMFLPSGILHNT